VSVRSENRLVQTVFCDILSEKTQFYLYQVHVRTAWPSVRTVFAKILSLFDRNSGIFWNTGLHSDVFPCCLDGLQRLPKQFRLLKSNSLLNIDWPSVWTMLLWCPDGFIVICWTLRSVRMPSKARSDGCTGTDCFCLLFCKDSSWTSLSSLWSVIVFDLIIAEYVKILNWKPTILLKSNPYIKCSYFIQKVADIKY